MNLHEELKNLDKEILALLCYILLMTYNRWDAKKLIGELTNIGKK